MSTTASSDGAAVEPTVDLAQLAPILRDLGTGKPVALTPMAGGSAQVLRVDLADGGVLVLKIYDDIRQTTPAREVYATRLLHGLDLPVTRYLALDETRTRLPFRYAITNYLPGATAGSLKSASDIADVYRQMGAAIKKLHAVRMPAYGHFDENGLVAPVATNAAFVRNLADDAFRQFRRYGGGDALAARLEAIVDARLDHVSWSRGPVFAHDDLHPNNVLAARDASGRLRLTGLIDFGNARAADAVFDLAKNIFCCEHEAPNCSVAIREGYGPIDHPDPEAALWLYTLLHRVIMWWWLRHVGVIADGEPHDLIARLHETSRQARP